MKSYWVRVDPKFNDWCSYKKAIRRHRGDTQGRRPYDNRDRNCKDTAISQEMARISSNCQKLEKKHGTDSPSEFPVGIKLFDTLILDF